MVVKLYSTASGSFSSVASPLYASHNSALYNLDPTNGGSAIEAATLYTQYNITEQSVDLSLIHI